MSEKSKDTEPKIGDLRVWHVPQFPGPVFRVPADSPTEAKKIIRALADYDLFQFKNKIKPDYANCSGLEVYEADGGDGEAGWCEWADQETGEEIDEWEPA
ncbi:hypothetical protein ACMHYO_11565 [Allopusillimonas ginsengisoli]|uniref:hypothetical protein n=1 Tax=Allopusillimonas ginsengisoli TaxID=453575 RepID=UPI0039C459C7